MPFTRLMGGPMDYTPGIFEGDLSVYGSNKAKLGTRVLNGVGKTASKKLHQQVIEVFSTSSDDYPVRRYRYSTVASQVS